jgi:hypothetical protein
VPRATAHLPSRWKAQALAHNAAVAAAPPKAILARNNFAIFLEYVLRKKPARHHLIWITRLVTGNSSDILHLIAGENLEILAPRGSAKSTIIGAWCAWVIGHNPAIRIIYTSYSQSVALSRSRLIKRLIEKKQYQEVFPHIVKGDRWADTDWEINKLKAGVSDAAIESDYTFYAVGITGSITSRRSDLIIYDDIIKSSKSIENPDVRQKILDNVGEVIQPTIVPGGREVSIGTRFRPDDIHSTEFIPENGWQVVEQSAIEIDEVGEEVSYWPERFELPKLQHIRERKPVIFSFQYQNKIIRISDTSIDPTWIKRGHVPTDVKEYEQLVLGLAGRIGDEFYVLDCRRGRWPGNQDKIDVLLEMCLDWGIIEENEDVGEGEPGQYYSLPVTLYFHAEDVQYQASMSSDFKRFVTNKHGIYNIVYRPAKTRGSDKLSRLRGVTGIFQNGLITFNQYRMMGVLIDELTNFGSAENDDTVDAIVYALQFLAQRTKLDAA